MLTNNRAVKAAGGLWTIWFSTELPDYFPMTSTAFWLQWRLWGESPLGYHLVNVLLHAFSAVLWWRVLAKLALPGAWLAAALFALHPVNVESVAWISELKNTLAMLFYALMALAYVHFDDTGRRRWYAASLGIFLLALLSKTAVSPFPAVLLGFAWWRRGRIAPRDMWRSAPFFAAAALLAVVTIWFQYERAIGSTVVRNDDFWARLAGAGWAVWFYLSKALAPLNLAIVYPRWQIDSANVQAYVPGVLVAAGLLLCWHFRNRWGRAWLFASGYFIAMLLPILGFFNIGAMRYSLVADRWQYFAILAPIVLGAAGIARALQRIQGAHRLLAPTLCGALLLLLGVATWRQSTVYRNPQTLWHTTLARNPDCSIAHNEVGSELFEKGGRTDEAIVHFRRAIEILPDYEVAYYNLGCALLEKGREDEAIAAFRRSIAVEPELFNPHYNLGTTLLNRGELDEALGHLKKAAELAPEDARAHNNYGTALLQKKQLEAAMRQYQIALSIEPNHASAHSNLGWIFFKAGRADEAMEHLQKALELQPGNARTHHNLGEIFMQRGQTGAALAHFEAALKIQPDYPEARINLGHALVQVGRAVDAIAHLSAAIAAAPADADAHNNLANALLQTGEVAEAERQYRKTLEIAPGHAKANNNLGWVLFQTRRRDEAIGYFHRAIETDPAYANAHRNLADVLLEASEVDAAITHLEKAVALQPDDASAQSSLGDAWLRKGRPSEAIARYDLALKLQPDDPALLTRSAWLLATADEAAMRNGARATALARRAREISGGKDPAVLRVLAAASAEEGRMSEAREFAGEALRLAESRDDLALAEKLRREGELYRSGQPVRTTVKEGEAARSQR
ncbi:MAG: tetratricopeptide repeat protein [Nibricoccus sp.]